MVRLFVILAAVQLVLLVLALISCLSADRVRAMPRALWVLVILLIPLLGPIAWYLFGRPLPPPVEGGRARRGPSSPDDDPDFLRSIRIEQTRRDRELLDRWERELQDRQDRRPEEDHPRQDEEDGPASRPPASGA
jgi:hypothetical protein